MDVWKMIGYDPSIKGRRVRWIFDGDGSCAYDIRQGDG